MNVAVIGGETVTASDAEQAHEVGRLLAERGHTIVCGGLGGVMEAACEGAKSAEGTTIGILPVADRTAANEYVDVPIATGLGHARNALVVMNGDAVIAIDGGGGTLTEIGYAHVYEKPIAGLGTHEIEGLDHIEHVETGEEAVAYVVE